MIRCVPHLAWRNYDADCRRGSGDERVVCVLLTEPADVLSKANNVVLTALTAAGVSSAVGLYFYRFKSHVRPFIKIGECTRQDGIHVRFRRGWHGTARYSDTYLMKRGKDKAYIDSEFALQIQKNSPENPAYFVFYEHSKLYSHPKIDEMFAYRMHQRLFKQGTASPERMNGNPLLARRLVWHKKAFSEVVRCKFPDGTFYPGCKDD